MKEKKTFGRLAGCFLVVLALLILAGTTEKALGKTLLSGPNLTPPQLATQGILEERVFTIDDKAPKTGYIFISERRFRVAHGTTILDYGGKDIPLKRLPTPCRAKVTYRLFGDHRDPMVEKIRLW